MLHRLRVRDRGDDVSFRHERALPGIVLRFPALAAELVRLKVDAIVALYLPSALAAKQATHGYPNVEMATRISLDHASHGGSSRDVAIGNCVRVRARGTQAARQRRDQLGAEQ